MKAPWQIETHPLVDGHQTRHTSKSGELRVKHEPRTFMGTPRPHGTHLVNMYSKGAAHDTLFSWPTQQHGTERAFLSNAGVSHYVDPPSPELRALIEAHGQNPAWMPLLDKLAEEYPEHFEKPVAQHTQQRFS